jgi:hypothetical protein
MVYFNLIITVRKIPSSKILWTLFLKLKIADFEFTNKINNKVWVWGTFRDANGRLGVGTGEDDDKEVEKAILKEPAKLSLPHKVK